MRLFVAVDVPGAARDRVLDAVAPLHGDDRMAWTRPAGWHLTLAFLGEVEQDALDDVVGAVERGVGRAGVPSVALATGEVMTLGRGALALVVSDDPPGALERLGRAIQRSIATADLPVTQRPVRPHLTLGRARRRRPVPVDLAEQVAVPPVTWTAGTVHVVRSVVGSGPATYEVLATVAMSDV